MQWYNVHDFFFFSLPISTPPPPEQVALPQYRKYIAILITQEVKIVYNYRVMLFLKKSV